MPNYCKLIIAGHVGRDPEVKTLDGGRTLANFSVAVSEKRGGEQATTWFRCTAFGKTAEVVGQYVKKGRAVMVEGRIASRKYTKDGAEREAWDVTADRVVFLSSGERDEAAATPPDGEIPF